jgi:cell division protein FtsN
MRTVPVPPARAFAQQGTLVLGLMIGMLCGLAVAVIVAVFVTRAPLPFVNKLPRSGDRVAEISKAGGDLPDPNRGIGSSRPALPIAGAPRDPAAPSAPAAATAPTTESADPALALASPGERVLYMLQAGAFRSSDDADNMRAKLALIGFEARVSAAEVGNERLFRVRIGPYGQLDDVNLARFRLAENGIEATVVRQR